MRLISQRGERQICGHSAANSYSFQFGASKDHILFSPYLVMATSTVENFWVVQLKKAKPSPIYSFKNYREV